MKNHKKTLGIVGAITMMIIASFFVLIGIVKANPSYFLQTVQTNTATSTLSFIATSTGSATLKFDSYYVDSGTPNGNTLKMNDAVLFVQTTASSTSSVYSIALQYSQDGVDWYGDTSGQVISSSILDISTSTTYKITAASTTVALRSILVKTPTRYVRAVATVTGANGSIWMQFVPNREKSEGK